MSAVAAEGPVRALALRLEGPLQSYGAAALGDGRPSDDRPTKSAVLGLVGAALGLARSDVAQHVALERGLALVVRVDREGSTLVDFHTVQGSRSAASWGPEGRLAPDDRSTRVTRRRYLCDASFVALLVERGPLPWSLEQLFDALRAPRFPLALGRRACAPSVPVHAAGGVRRAESWEQALAQVRDAERDEPVRSARGRVAERHAWVYVERGLALGGGAGQPSREALRRDRFAGPAPRMFASRYERAVPYDPGRHGPPGAARPGPSRGAASETVDAWL